MHRILIAAFLMGCGNKKVDMDKQTQQVINADIPGWVLNPPKGKNEICAVGSYKMKGNISMAQQASTSRARDELSRQLLVQTKSMIKDYIAEGETGGESYTEEVVESVSKQVTANSLSGTQQAKQEMMDGSLYTLVCLDTEKFVDAFDNMTEVSEKAKKALRARASEGFKELDEEVDKMNAQ